MYKLLTALCLLILSSVGVFAQAQTRNDFGSSKSNPFAGDSKTEAESQNSTTNSNGYNKNEFYIGYSNQQVDTFGRSSFHGIQGAYTRNVSRWFGIRADVSYARSNTTLQGSLPNPSGGTFEFRQDLNRSLAQFLGGVQIKDNASTSRFKPFAFALGGVAVSRTTLKNFACTTLTNCPSTVLIINNATFNDSSFAASFGGGVDIKINRRIDFRAIQVDYNPIFSNGRIDNNFRIGIGFVFK
jgi:hypothetical protein